jgi:hypothetical protein
MLLLFFAKPDPPPRKKPLRLVDVAWCEDGMTVWIGWNRERNSYLPCKVTCAAGNMARVENLHHNVRDKWLNLNDLRVPEGDPHTYD